MTSITFTFVDRPDITVGSPSPLSKNHIFNPGDKCRVRSVDSQQYRIGEFTGYGNNCGVGKVYIKFDNQPSEEIDISDIAL